MEHQDTTIETIEPTIGQMVADDYRKAIVFKKFGIDFCCGGKDPLDRACQKKGVKLTDVRQALSELDKQGSSSKDFLNWDLDRLIDHIINVHHNYLNEAIPVLIEFSSKVARVHGEKHPELVVIDRLFREMVSELRLHMEKEETILFPYIREMVLARRHSQTLSASSFGSIMNPINMMEQEHESAGGNIQKIAELSNGFQPPESACATYKVLFAKLHEFEEDLHQHVHLENNILFPAAINLENQLLS